MPSLSTAEYEIFKKIIKRTMDSKYFVVRKEQLTYDSDSSEYRVILEHSLSSDNIVINVDYEMTESINNSTTKFAVSKVDENKILVKSLLPIDFYVIVESNVFRPLTQAEVGPLNSITCGPKMIVGSGIKCGQQISELERDTNKLTPVEMF